MQYLTIRERHPGRAFYLTLDQALGPFYSHNQVFRSPSIIGNTNHGTPAITMLWKGWLQPSEILAYSKIRRNRELWGSGNGHQRRKRGELKKKERREQEGIPTSRFFNKEKVRHDDS